MDVTVVASVIVGLVAGGGRLLCTVLRERAAAKDRRAYQKELSARVRLLPPGSRLTERHPGHGDVIVEVGVTGGSRG